MNKVLTEKYCKYCDQILPINEFSRHTNKKRWRTYCKKCSSIISQKYYIPKNGLGGPSRGGRPPKVKLNPLEYNNDQEKKETEKFLRSLGWKYHIKNNLWYKPGVKSINGKWIKPKH